MVAATAAMIAQTPSAAASAARQTDGGWKYEASYHDRPRRPGCDVDRCFTGAITLSRIRVDS